MRLRIPPLASVTIVIAAFVMSSGMVSAQQQAGGKIVHDAEYAILEDQHGEKWAAEDKELDKKLAELRRKFGQPPNIIHIMWDDSGYGDVGHPILTNIHGVKTPVIDKLAGDGITFTRMYTEPSCTPTRTAFMTGRHPIRSGNYQVIFPVHGIGLPAEEVTLAELLSEVGYKTGFFGKAHLGDIEESYLHNQGFDEALFSLYNQFASQFFNEDGESIFMTFGFNKDQIDKKYALDGNFRKNDVVWAVEGKKGQKGKRFNKDYSYEEQLRFAQEAHKRSLDFIKRNAKGNKPFFLCYWWHGPHMAGVPRMGRRAYSARDNAFGDAVEELDKLIGEIIETVREEGIENNTLVIVMADNGPMLEIFPHHAFQLFRGGKGAFTEGGVRVPAFAYWPGVIEKGQVVGDIIHVSDLYTTFTRLGGAKDNIPTDRVIDGIDQTALLLKGDGHSRRDYVHIYSGPVLAATVKQQFKRHWMGERPGLVGKSFFDLYKDPREEHGLMAQFLWAWEPFDAMKERHQSLMKKYPNTPVRRGQAAAGLE